MRTIPAAMTWELLSRGRWTIPAALLGAIAFPSLILAALNSDGYVDPQDPAIVLLHLFLAQFSMFVAAAAVFVAQGPMSRLYAYPARTSTLVAWRMAPAMGVVALLSAVSTLVINSVFGLTWPVGSTALFLAVAVAAVQAALWLTEASAWVIVALSGVSAALGLWLKSRYGPMFDDPTRLWTAITSLELLTMLLAAVLSYGVAVFSVGRNRRGEPPISIGVVKLLERLLTRTPTAAGPFASPARAQLWSEWQRKGWIMPTCAAAGLVVGFAAWLGGSRNLEDLVQGVIAGGGMLILVGIIGGLALGNVGRGDADYAMSSFLAAKPMSGSEMARIILQTAVKSLLMAWLLWAAAFAVVIAIVAAVDGLPHGIFPDGLGWWYFPVTIVGPWTAIAVCMSAGLVGRPKGFIQLVVGLTAAYIGLTLASKMMLTPRVQSLWGHVIVSTLSIALVVGTAWIFVAARRRELISLSTMLAASLAWGALVAAVVATWPLNGAAAIPAYAFLGGVLALAVAPFAAAPLAITWNRHR